MNQIKNTQRELLYKLDQGILKGDNKTVEELKNNPQFLKQLTKVFNDDLFENQNDIQIRGDRMFDKMKNTNKDKLDKLIQEKIHTQNSEEFKEDFLL